jgi:hypothetical protein
VQCTCSRTCTGVQRAPSCPATTIIMGCAAPVCAKHWRQHGGGAAAGRVSSARTRVGSSARVKATRVGLQGYTGRATRLHGSYKGAQVGYKASVVTATRVHGSTYMGTTGPLTRVARARRHPGYSFQCPNATHISLWNLPASQEEGV